MAEYNITSLSKLVEQFERLPGIGHKTAFKLAYHVLRMSEEDARKFSDTIVEAHAKIRLCSICCNFTDKEVCSICSAQNRDRSTVCVVEDPRDVVAFEHTGEYKGLYHVLHGSVSPLNGVTPEMLHIKELLARLKTGEVKEIIMATNPTVEGEATSMYLSKLIKPLGVKLTRLAYGVPVGSDLEYADEVTLTRALKGRLEI